MNVTQQLKLLGLLREVSLDCVKDAEIPEALQQQAQELESYCGNPIHRDEEIATSDPDTVNEALGLEDPELAGHVILLHNQTPADDELPDDAQALGSGSWRAGCSHMTEWYGDQDHSMTYYVERDTFSSGWRRPITDSEYQDIVDLEVYDEEVANGMGVGSPFGRLKSVEDCKISFVHKTEESARDAGVSVGDPLDVLDLCFLLTEEINRRVGCACVRVYTGPSGAHNAHARGKDLPGGLAGYAFFNDGTCGDHVNMFLDNLLRSGFLRLLNLTAHEFGHWLNLLHQFSNQGTHRELMSYSTMKWSAQGYSNGGSPFRLPRAPSLRPLQRFFDWENHIPPMLGETPPPPPPDTRKLPGEIYGEIIHRGSRKEVAIRGELSPKGTYDGESFIIVPKPGDPGKFIAERKGS